jgi:ubiquinone/menaquinone biosynthesis C-methylase UbiE
VNSSSAGSYAFGRFEQNSEELTRLKRQAAAAQSLERQILKRSGLSAGMRVLDLACGPGVVSCELAHLAAPGQVTGIDLSPELLDQARALAQERNIGNLNFQPGDVYALDLPHNQFDFVYARFLFQHLKAIDQALVEIQRILKPGGVCTIADVDDGWLALHPEPESFRSFIERADCNQARQGGDRNVGRKLGAYLQEAGFEQVRVHVDTITSTELGMQGFLDLTTGFKHGQLKDEDRQQSAIEREQIYQLLDTPNAWGYVGIFVATGNKPSA